MLQCVEGLCSEEDLVYLELKRLGDGELICKTGFTAVLHTGMPSSLDKIVGLSEYIYTLGQYADHLLWI